MRSAGHGSVAAQRQYMQVDEESEANMYKALVGFPSPARKMGTRSQLRRRRGQRGASELGLVWRVAGGLGWARESLKGK